MWEAFFVSKFALNLGNNLNHPYYMGNQILLSNKMAIKEEEKIQGQSFCQKIQGSQGGFLLSPYLRFISIPVTFTTFA